MSQLILTRQQVRQIDRRAVEDYGMLSMVLMENAGRGCVEVLQSLGAQGPVAIACGKGNNGGDGFVIARHLDNLGIEVRVLLFADAEELTGDAAANFQLLKYTDVSVKHFASYTADESRRLEAAVTGSQWIIDALLGTGATGDPRPPLDEVIFRLNEHPARKLAVDLPSGLDCDTGRAGRPTFHANHTCTFVAAKPGLLADGARQLTGILHVVDIGVPKKLVADVASQTEL